MISSVVFVSNVQQSDSVIHIHVSVLFQILSPFRLLQNVEFPVLYNRSLLVIYFKYNSVYMLIQPPDLSLPTLVTIRLFSASVSLFLFCKYVHLCHVYCAPFCHVCIFHVKLQVLKLFRVPSKLIFQSWSLVFSPLGYALIEAFFSPYFVMSSIQYFYFPHLHSAQSPCPSSHHLRR